MKYTFTKSPSTLSLAATLALTLISALALSWLISFREVRLKIGDYYFKHGTFDQAVGWYGKVVRKDRLVAHQDTTDQLKYKEDIFKLKSALLSLARDHLNRILNNFEFDISDFNSFDRTMTECENITKLLENYRVYFTFNLQEFSKTFNEIQKEIKIKENDICFAFGERYVQMNMWHDAKQFFTKKVLKYMNPINTLEKLGKLYGNNPQIKEKIWGGDIFVTLEDFEDTSKPILTDWARSTEPIVNFHAVSSEVSRSGNNSEYFDLSYSKQEGYDYWVKSVNIPLSNPELVIGIRLFIKSKEPFKGYLKINVLYPKQKTSGVWHTDLKKDIVDGWEERRIDNLFEKSKIIALRQNWAPNGMMIDNIIIDTQGVTNKFYVDSIELFLIDR